MFRILASFAFACVVATLSSDAVRSAGTAIEGQPEACRTATQVLDRETCWWATYMDYFFGVTIDYPADLLRAEPFYSEGAGRRFASKDGAMILSVWGGPATGKLSITETMAIDLYRSGFQTVTDQKADAYGYIIGGRHGAREFLKRVRWTDSHRRIVETACITWPTDRDGEIRPLAVQIVATLRDGRGWARNPRADISGETFPEGTCRGL